VAEVVFWLMRVATPRPLGMLQRRLPRWLTGTLVPVPVLCGLLLTRIDLFHEKEGRGSKRSRLTRRSPGCSPPYTIRPNTLLPP